MAYIEMKHSYKRYKTGDVEIIANNDISFEIEKGELVIILGSSGAGKSTVLNILGGMDTNDEGKVIIDGKDISNYNAKELTAYRRDDVGFVFQFYNLVSNLTAKENVELASEIVSDAKDAEQTLVDVGLGKRINNFPAQLSGGEQQRVAIARAIVNQPNYLFCDEPNSGLDPKTSIVIDNLIQEITEEFNITTVINTHDMNSVMGIGENIVFIYKGHKEWQGNKDEIINSTNKKLNDLVFASDLFKKVKEVETEEHNNETSSKE